MYQPVEWSGSSEDESELEYRSRKPRYWHNHRECKPRVVKCVCGECRPWYQIKRHRNCECGQCPIRVPPGYVPCYDQ